MAKKIIFLSKNLWVLADIGGLGSVPMQSACSIELLNLFFIVPVNACFPICQHSVGKN